MNVNDCKLLSRHQEGIESVSLTNRSYENNAFSYEKIERPLTRTLKQKMVACWKGQFKKELINALSIPNGQGLPRAIKIIQKGGQNFIDATEIQKLSEKGNQKSIEFLLSQATFPKKPSDDRSTASLISVLKSIEQMSQEQWNNKNVACFLDSYLKYRPLNNLRRSDQYETNLKQTIFKKSLEYQAYPIASLFLKHGLDPKSCILHFYHGKHYHIVFENLSLDSLKFWFNAGLTDQVFFFDGAQSTLNLLGAAVVLNQVESAEFLLEKGYRAAGSYKGSFSFGRQYVRYEGTLIEIAVENGYERMVDLLLKYGEIPNAAAIEKASLATVPKLLKAHSNPQSILTGSKGLLYRELAGILNKNAGLN